MERIKRAAKQLAEQQNIGNGARKAEAVARAGAVPCKSTGAWPYRIVATACRDTRAFWNVCCVSNEAKLDRGLHRPVRDEAVAARLICAARKRSSSQWYPADPDGALGWNAISPVSL